MRSLTGPALAATAGLVLADSSVVVLALPDIYRELDVSVTTVTWVLIGFNVVLAAAAVPAAMTARSLGPARITVVCIDMDSFRPVPIPKPILKTFRGFLEKGPKR